MNTIFRFIGLLTPNKRRRTVGPDLPTQQSPSEHSYHPVSEPRTKSTQATLRNRSDRRYTLYADTRFKPGSRKRVRDESDDFDTPDELNSQTSSVIASDDHIKGEGDVNRDNEEMPEDKDEYEGKGGLKDEENLDVVSPGDSASQITPLESSVDGSQEGEAQEAEWEIELEGHEEVEEGKFDDVEWQAEQETTAQKKVQEYLARQVELMSRQEEFKKNIAGGKWHPDELYLFDRLSMRSFEPIFPLIWQLDLPTLNPALFSKGTTFFNSNHAGRDYG